MKWRLAAVAAAGAFVLAALLPACGSHGPAPRRCGVSRETRHCPSTAPAAPVVVIPPLMVPVPRPVPPDPVSEDA